MKVLYLHQDFKTPDGSVDKHSYEIARPLSNQTIMSQWFVEVIVAEKQGQQRLQNVCG